MDVVVIKEYLKKMKWLLIPLLIFLMFSDRLYGWN